MIVIGRESSSVSVHPLVGVHHLGESAAASGRGEMSCLAEIRVVQHTSVPVHVLVTHHVSVARRRLNIV